MKIYQTGPDHANHAILFIYDIFGFSSQALQGADILAHADAEKPYNVFVPDWFDGNPADINIFPAKTPEQKAQLAEFFKTTAAPQNTVDRLPKVMAVIKDKVKSFERWGVVGFCWGGKIVNLTCQDGTPFKAAACAHPAMVNPEDAPAIKVPILMLPSKDEDAQAVEAWKSKLTVAHEVETFSSQIHGWMGARADLDDEQNRKEYERGYLKVLEFFHERV